MTCTELNDRCTGQAEKWHWFWGCSLFSKNGTVWSFRHVQTNCKIFRNAAEEPCILLNTGISMLRNDTEACGPCPKAWRQHWLIQRELCNQTRAATPSHGKLKHKTKGFASSNAIKVNSAEITFWPVTSFTRWRSFFLYNGDFLL